MVGFGISDGESAKAIATTADAVVVGSALIDKMEQVASGGETPQIQIHGAAVKLLQRRDEVWTFHLPSTPRSGHRTTRCGEAYELDDKIPL